MIRLQDIGQNLIITAVTSRSYESVVKFKDLGTRVADKNYIH
jgi:hypothetical protein